MARFSVVVRAVLTGLVVMAAGQFPSSILIVANLRHDPHSPPWAVRDGALSDAVLALFERLGLGSQERPDASRSPAGSRTAGPYLA